MSEDPRWQQALQLLRQAEAAHDRGDSSEMARSFESCLNTLNSLAVDPAVARAERRWAAQLIEKTDAQLRADLPGLLHRLAEMRDSATDADQRAEFAEMMAHVTRRLPAASNARH
ncbi:MAG: hypothetical protein WB697_02700 [Stellaceae bacterium]